jgi:hypothetical protein
MSNTSDVWTSPDDARASFATRMRDRVRALRHLVDLRAQIAEHPWHAMAAAMLLGAWMASGESRPAPVEAPAAREHRRRVPNLIKAMLIDAALTVAREALSRQVAKMARTEPHN